MPAPAVPIREREGAAPEPAPLAPFARTDSSVSLGVARLGTVAVSADGITVTGPDAQSRSAVLDRLGCWAQAQWLLLQGLGVLRGTVVARGDRCVALTGGSQQGASITAAAMSKLGWGLVSDGLVVFDSHGVALMREPAITLDTMAAERLMPHSEHRTLASGRPRTAVAVAGHGDASLTDVVQIRVTNAVDTLVLTRPGDHANPLPRLLRGQLPASSTIDALPELGNWILARPIPIDAEMLGRVLPPMVAQLLDSAFSAAVQREEASA